MPTTKHIFSVYQNGLTKDFEITRQVLDAQPSLTIEDKFATLRLEDDKRSNRKLESAAYLGETQRRSGGSREMFRSRRTSRTRNDRVRRDRTPSQTRERSPQRCWRRDQVGHLIIDCPELERAQPGAVGREKARRARNRSRKAKHAEDDEYSDSGDSGLGARSETREYAHMAVEMALDNRTNDEWLTDGGALSHVTPNPNIFTTFKPRGSQTSLWGRNNDEFSSR
jgi:hypothetical protein